jgi:drug/metabolite transporter (DMT)-like permease
VPFSFLSLAARIYGNAWLLLLLTTLFWGGNVVAARLAIGAISPMVLICLRWGLVSAVLAATARDRLRDDWVKLKPSWRFVALMGTFGFTIYNALYFEAAHWTSGVNLAIIQGVSPASILIGAKCVFGQRIGAIRWTGLVLTLAGTALIATRGDLATLAELSFNSGDLLMIVASLIYAAYTLALPNKPKVSALGFFAGIAFAAFVSSVPLMFAEVAAGAAVWPHLPGLLVLLYVAIFPSLLAQVFFIRGVEMIGPARAGLFYNLVPVLGSLLAVMFLGERFAWYDGAALALVVAGITLAEQQRQL